jgi:hypothetical protein
MKINVSALFVLDVHKCFSNDGFYLAGALVG